MLKVECESCKAPYQVDERRVPPTGLKMRCPKCGHTFVVKNPALSAGAIPAAAAPTPAAAPLAPPAKPPGVPQVKPAVKPDPSKQTMVGVGGGPPRPPPRPMVKPPLPPRANPPAAAAPTASVFDDDLPAVADDLPATVMRKAPIPAEAVPPDFGDLDLPSPIGADLPAVARGGGGADLPAVARGGAGADLPAVARGNAPALPKKPAPPPPPDFGDLDLPAITNDLPAPKKPVPPPAPDFGDLDLPAITNDLPAVQNNLPQAKRGEFGEIDLPSIADNLPSVQNNLPSVQNNLPAIANMLPIVAAPGMSDFGDLDLPTAQGTNMQLPAIPSAPPMDMMGSVFDSGPPPQPQHQDANSLPPAFGGGGSFGDPGGFGELDLPPPGQEASIPPPNFGGDDDHQSAFDPPQAAEDDFGEAPLEQSENFGEAAGGMAFGEVDLGGGGGEEEPIEGSIGTEAALQSGPPPNVGTLAPEEEEQPDLSLAEPEKRARPQESRPKASNLPKILGGALVLALVGGVALVATPYGAFGYYVISDSIKEKDYNAAAVDAAAKARALLASDTYGDAKKAVEAVTVAHALMPRARALATYAALVEFEVELRFGVDPTSNARAKSWLQEITSKAGVKYITAAQAGQDAVAGDLVKGRTGFEAASKKDSGDPIQQEIAIGRGEVELAAQDGAAATEAFKRALELAPSARTHFGLARAALLVGDVKTTKAEIAATLAASPNHIDAITMRAQVAWQNDHDVNAALADLAKVVEIASKTTASSVQLARAQALRGWIMLELEKTQDARTAFEDAYKLDPRNVSALAGQGEVLYEDGRYTEALGRFDKAVDGDAKNVDAIVGDAKSKIALERLADAKGQLSAARAALPKEMRIALWLGKAEEALGNKAAAEQQYIAAIDLADPQKPDAISAYVALASMLASQGRAEEAQAKLDAAKAKLPDSAVLQRSLGEVSAAQGHFEEAVAHYEASLQKDPNDIATRFRLGVTLRRMRKTDAATAELDKVYAADKDYPGLALERGLLFEETGEVQRALEMFQSALAKAPNDPDLLLRVGAAYVAIGRPDDGLVTLKKVLEQRPNSPEANHFIGRAFLLQGPLQAAAAMRYLKRAVELDPHRAQFHLYVGWAANDTGDLGTAVPEIAKALQLDPLMPEAYWQQGSIAFKQSQVEEAIKYLRRALELRPTLYEAHATLADCYEKKNDVATALAEWSRAIAADDKRPFWHYRFGKLLLQRNNTGEAEKHLSFAAQGGDKETPAPGWLADADFLAAEAHRKLGQRAMAVERYKAFLAIAPLGSPDRQPAREHLAELGAQ